MGPKTPILYSVYSTPDECELPDMGYGATEGVYPYFCLSFSLILPLAGERAV